MDFFNRYGTVLAVWRRYFPGGGSNNNNNNNNKSTNTNTNTQKAMTNISSSGATDEATGEHKSNNVSRTKPSIFVVFETA